VLAIVAVVLALALACPDEDSFHRYLDKATAREDDPVFAKAADAILTAQESLTAEYHDHVLWATVEARRGTQRHRYVGVMGIWLELDDR
jgi:hypothetical protein